MISQAEVAARVARGAAHLDQVRPGWFNEIDPGTLTLSNPCGCIVGQLVGGSSYSRFVSDTARLFPPLRQRNKARAPYYGVDLDTDLLIGGVTFSDLQDAWIAEIAARRFPESQDSTATVDAASPPVDHLSVADA